MNPSLAVLGLLAAAARHQPVLCLLDDAHLLDTPSWQAVSFAARRAGGERLAILATVPAGTETGGLPVRRLAPLTPDAARELLAHHAPDLAEEVAAAVAELSGGNPAALLDLVDALSPEQRRGYAPPPETLPPGSSLRRRYRAELDALPAPTRELVLLAAALPQAPLTDVLAAAAARDAASVSDPATTGHAATVTDRATAGTATSAGDPATVSDATSACDPDEQPATASWTGFDRGYADGRLPGLEPAAGAEDRLRDFEPAERAGLITVSGDEVRFVSPLLRACAYAEAPVGRRQAAHAALARVAAARDDHLNALLHRAAATTG
ncbi:hypothetical protein AB0F81_51385, partial [Actinoplanes sp. NPDC024001]